MSLTSSPTKIEPNWQAAWESLCGFEALLQGGWAGPLPPMPLNRHSPAPALDAQALVGWAARYGAGGQGSPRPKVLVIEPQAGLGEAAVALLKTMLDFKLSLDLNAEVFRIPFKPGQEEILAAWAQALAPRAVWALGEGVCQALLGIRISLDTLRGRDYDWKGLPLVPGMDLNQYQKPLHQGLVVADLDRLKGIVLYGG